MDNFFQINFDINHLWKEIITPSTAQFCNRAVKMPLRNLCQRITLVLVMKDSKHPIPNILGNDGCVKIVYDCLESTSWPKSHPLDQELFVKRMMGSVWNCCHCLYKFLETCPSSILIVLISICRNIREALKKE